MGSAHYFGFSIAAMGSQKGNAHLSTLDLPAKSRIHDSWPANDLEEVGLCPYCSSSKRALEYGDVQDWAFHNAPGKWSYWRCRDCDALYLSPRPTAESIGRAYSTYYTHDRESKPFWLRFKNRLRNEYFSHVLGISLHPRLRFQKYLGWMLLPLNSMIVMPFGLSTLAQLPKGKLVDVGCGNGDMLQFSIQMGWDGIGIELDQQAISACRKNGLTVIEGSYEKLDDYPSLFDCIICSHVLEHVHDPMAVLEKMKFALKPGGILLLSCPNAMSRAGQYFGVHWRGLEAPRHIAIPSAHFLRGFLEKIGFQVEQNVFNGFPSLKQSLEIEAQSAALLHDSHKNVSTVKQAFGSPSPDEVDFIELICTKI
jgi:2-polyprenyl-3-methyl-5-hydroxy-6-metoxy-1,4-benzoquinol methylase